MYIRTDKEEGREINSILPEANVALYFYYLLGNNDRIKLVFTDEEVVSTHLLDWTSYNVPLEDLP